MGLENIACCYHSLTAYLIQYLLITAIILGMISNILGFILILWEYISKFILFLYVLCFCLYILSGISTLLIIYYRRNKTINSINNRRSIQISIGNIIISIFGLILGTICLIVCSVRYYDHEADVVDGKRAINGWDKFYMFLLLGLNMRFFLFMFFLWLSLLLRLYKKTNGAYSRSSGLNTSTTSIDNNANIGTNNNNNIITKEVRVTYGNRELNLK